MEVTNLNDTNLVEVSSFFLFEATGDSDAVLEAYYPVSDSVNADGGGDDDDDAESCCWDSAGIQCPSKSSSGNLDSSANDDEASNSIIDRECSNDDDEEEQEEEGEDLRSEIGRSGMGRRKSSGSDDSTAEELEALTETEKNRLFWEACLSS